MYVSVCADMRPKVKKKSKSINRRRNEDLGSRVVSKFDIKSQLVIPV